MIFTAAMIFTARARAYGALPLSSEIVLLNQVLFVRSYSGGRPLRGLTFPLCFLRPDVFYGSYLRIIITL